MKSISLYAGTIMAGTLIILGNARGAGFGIYEGSARGNAMGTEVTADPASPSVIYNNPAAMTALPGTQSEAGFTAIRPHVKIVTETPMGAAQSKGKSSWWTPPHLYLTQQVDERIWLGFGVFSRYGLGVKYDSDWAGRYNCVEATIRSVDLNPSIAFKLLDNLSVAAGFRAEWFEFKLDQAIPTGSPFVDPDLQFHLRGDSWDYGYNLGVYYEATDRISFGLSYESEIDHDVTGSYRVNHPHPALGGGGGNGDVTTPSILRFGTSVKASDSLKINAGVVYTMWSSYKELAMQFDPYLLGSIPGTAAEKKWKDVMRYQFGVEYALDETWALRAGYVFDETPVRNSHVDYIVPANDRHLLGFGVGYRKDSFVCDVGYTYLVIRDRDVQGRPQDGVLSGKFKDGDAHMIGISLGYKL